MPRHASRTAPSRPARDLVPAPGPDDSTIILPPPGAERIPARPRRPHGHSSFRWMRSLRWRLALFYAGLLTLLMVGVALVLNQVIGQVVYGTAANTFQSEAKSGVATNERFFDAEVRGRSAGGQCLDAIGFQQAFDQTIAAQMLASHAGVQSVYLLDRFGNVQADMQASGTDQTQPGNQAQPGEPGPYLLPGKVRTLFTQTLAAPRTGTTGYITDVSYTTTDTSRQRIGVVLIAERYYIATRCAASTGSAPTAVGIVEVITTFPQAQAVMAALRLLLVVAVLAVLVAGVAIGGPLTATALRPLTRMTQAARRIASGDLSQRVRLPQSGDEIGQLADTFDEMIARIEVAFTLQRASEERMRQFIADASHELRTPLTSIRGYTDVLLRGAKDDPATTERVLQATRREAERMTRLVNDLLTLARLDAGRPLERRPVDLVALAGEAVDQARIVAGQREVALATDGGGRLVLDADADRLKQVLLILLDNALKYGRQDASGWVRVRVARDERAAIVRVADNGEGILPADLPHIFDRFYRAERAARQRRLSAPPRILDAAPTPGAHDLGRSPSGGPAQNGSGLGLPIAQAIVLAHGGTIRVESRPGAGTTFTLMIPLIAPTTG